MSAVLAVIVRQIGFAGCALLLLLGYYEGVPGLRDIPYVTSIPILREFLDGRVQNAAADAVKRATRDLVERTELTAARAKAAELEKQITKFVQMADAARRQADTARIDAETARNELEAKIENDTSDDGCTWSDRDLEWLRHK